MERYTVTFALETAKTVEVDVNAQTEEEAIQEAMSWAHDSVKHVDAPIRVGRVLRVERITP